MNPAFGSGRTPSGKGNMVSTFRITIAALLIPLLSQTSGAAEQNPFQWKEFQKVAGQPFEVPKEWLITKGGQLAHDLVLPETLPKPVPFDFSAARLKALLPMNPTVQMQYWQHLCATEAGQYIFKTVEKVDSFAYMRLSQVLKQTEADNDRWIYEAPGFERWKWRKEGRSIAGAYLEVPFTTYLSIELPLLPGPHVEPDDGPSNLWVREVRGEDEWERISRRGDEPTNPADHLQFKKWARERIAGPTEKFAVTWRGIRRPFDRDHLIAGHEWIVFDRSTREILAVLRDFAAAFGVRNTEHGFNWRNAATCRSLRTVFSDVYANNLNLVVLRTLQPSTPASLPKLNDQRVIQIERARIK
jgi:hypothetical protein